MKVLKKSGDKTKPVLCGKLFPPLICAFLHHQDGRRLKKAFCPAGCLDAFLYINLLLLIRFGLFCLMSRP